MKAMRTAEVLEESIAEGSTRAFGVEGLESEKRDIYRI